MADETKDATLTIRIKPSIKAKAVKRAAHEGRSLANYIERLIEQDAKR
jgi:predicted HicB family RNase H-like nuclease